MATVVPESDPFVVCEGGRLVAKYVYTPATARIARVVIITIVLLVVFFEEEIPCLGVNG
jgi:hypothetical protein